MLIQVVLLLWKICIKTNIHCLLSVHICLQCVFYMVQSFIIICLYRSTHTPVFDQLTDHQCCLWSTSRTYGGWWLCSRWLSGGLWTFTASPMGYFDRFIFALSLFELTKGSVCFFIAPAYWSTSPGTSFSTCSTPTLVRYFQRFVFLLSLLQLTYIFKCPPACANWFLCNFNWIILALSFFKLAHISICFPVCSANCFPWSFDLFIFALSLSKLT